MLLKYSNGGRTCNMNQQHTIETGTIPDNEIINRVLLGEKNLYSLIVRRYNQRLYRIAMSMVNDAAEAEDIMQTAYIVAYENLGKFAFKASFSTWLTKILINECLLRLKKRGRLTNMNDESIDNVLYQQHVMAVKTPADNTLNTELKEALEKAIRTLPEKYKVVFVMRELEGMNIAETKECLNISAVNVKVRLNRAKSLLKEALSQYYSKEDLFQFHLSRCNRMVESVMKQIDLKNFRISPVYITAS